MTRRWRPGRRWRHAERGASTPAILILSLPLLVGAFGFGFDSMRVAFLHNWLEQRVEMAAEQGAGYALYTGPDGMVTLGQPGDPFPGKSALDAAWENYTANTAPARAGGGQPRPLLCPDPTVLYGNPADPQGRCGLWVSVVDTRTAGGMADLCDPAKEGRLYGVRVVANETTPYTFLPILGLREGTLENINATSYLRSRTC